MMMTRIGASRMGSESVPGAHARPDRHRHAGDSELVPDPEARHRPGAASDPAALGLAGPRRRDFGPPTRTGPPTRRLLASVLTASGPEAVCRRQAVNTLASLTASGPGVLTAGLRRPGRHCRGRLENGLRRALRRRRRRLGGRDQCRPPHRPNCFYIIITLYTPLLHYLHHYYIIYIIITDRDQCRPPHRPQPGSAEFFT